MPIRRPSNPAPVKIFSFAEETNGCGSNRQAATPLLIPEEESAKLARVEGILFLAKEPLPSRKIRELATQKTVEK